MSTRKRRKKANNTLPIIIIGLVLALLALFIYQYTKVVQGTIKTDAATNCRSDGIFPRDTVVLLDATEAVSEPQLIDLSNQLEQVVRSSIIHERFTIYFLRDDPERFQPALVICNPGTGQNLSGNTNNLKKLMATWQESFRAPIKDSLLGLAELTPSSSSPIMEMLKFVGLRSFARSTSSDKRLILVSDMVEHNESYSQYRNRNLDFESLAQTRYFREMRPRLSDVMIDILYIKRHSLNEIQSGDHIKKFWQPFVRRSGGQIRDVTYIN
jgi:hypothetical protein